MIMKEGKESPMCTPPTFQHSGLVNKRPIMQSVGQPHYPSAAMQ